MNFHRVAIGLILTIASHAAWSAGSAIPADSMGLNKGSVFDVPQQKVYRDDHGMPGQNKLLPRAYLNAPPQIPHAVDDFLPITAQGNLCFACHNRPDQWGKKRNAGEATPIPPSHYTDLRNAPDKVTDQLIGARYNCNQCHVPQMNATPLVENTFSAKRAR